MERHGLSGPARIAHDCPYLQTRCVQPFAFSTLLPSAFRLLLGREFLLVKPLFHDLHCVYDQCDVAAIAGTLMLPKLMAATTAAVATRLGEII
jgi:hypothetical protein